MQIIAQYFCVGGGVAHTQCPYIGGGRSLACLPWALDDPGSAGGQQGGTAPHGVIRVCPCDWSVQVVGIVPLQVCPARTSTVSE